MQNVGCYAEKTNCGENNRLKVLEPMLNEAMLACQHRTVKA